MDAWRRTVTAALAALGTKRLALAIHDASFPAEADEELGRGSPYGRGAARFVEAMAALGFDALQLGPQGETSAFDPSPYDGTVMARNRASIAYGALLRDPRWRRLVDADTLTKHRRPEAAGFCDHDASHAAQEDLLVAAHRRLKAARAAGEAGGMDAALASFVARHDHWLSRVSLYAPLCRRHGHGDYRQWPDALDRDLWLGESPDKVARRQRLKATMDDAIERFVLGQCLVHAQHDAFRGRCQALSLRLQADLQIGLGPADTWCHRDAFMPGYLMGAPPSRTNPEGQPWGYPVLAAPGSTGGPAARRFVAKRLSKIFGEFDAVRIDHPHGWVCPWVYRAETDDALRAVQQGARLYSSPELSDHPALAAHAIVRAHQLQSTLPRHHDDWVRELGSEQVDAYAVHFDAIVAAAEAAGQRPTDLICEVLSTLPRPLAAVLDRHGLGRFRVTQKAKLDDVDDVYRSENARPRDWIMVGTHDTPSIWALARDWSEEVLRDQAAYLSQRLASSEAPASVAVHPEAVAQAKLAELFVSEAEHVMIFFADLFGQRERYNLPGTVGPHNWSLRVPPDWSTRYPQDAAAGRALHLPKALATALRARGLEPELAVALASLPPVPDAFDDGATTPARIG